MTFFGGDVEITEKALIKIQKLDVGADMAYATASESAKFTYKGTPNDDPSFTVSTVWKKVGGAWKLAHGHRSTATGNDVVVGRLRVMTRPAPVARPRLSRPFFGIA